MTIRSQAKNIFDAIEARDSGAFSSAGQLHWRIHILTFLFAAALIISRRPDVIFNPQFHTEDAAWFAGAYNYGWFAVFFRPYSGYLVIFERLGAALSLLVPVAFAPLVMNLIGIVAQALPANILISSRCRDWASLSTRGFMAFAYIALPSCSEINVTMTSAQWHLALLSCMVLLGRPAVGWKWQFFDCTIILLTGLSGPYCLVLLPIGLAFAWLRRSAWRLVPYAAVVVTSAIQLFVMHHLYTIHASHAAGGRLSLPLGATPGLFFHILAGQVYVNALVGATTLALCNTPGCLALIVVVVVIGTALLVYTAIRASLEMRLFLVFTVLIFGLSLRSPLMSATAPQWPVLAGFSGCRYFFFPMLAFVWCLIYCARSNRPAGARMISVSCLLLMLIWLPKTWRYQPDPDFKFGTYAKQLEAAPTGTVVKIPVYPGGDWIIYLKKH